MKLKEKYAVIKEFMGLPRKGRLMLAAMALELVNVCGYEVSEERTPSTKLMQLYLDWYPGAGKDMYDYLTYVKDMPISERWSMCKHIHEAAGRPFNKTLVEFNVEYQELMERQELERNK